MPRKPARARRPNADYLTLPQIHRLLDAAWELARRSRRDHANALRVEVALMSGLRGGELHALTPRDVRPDGTLSIRWTPTLKAAKPRIAALIGLEQSPTLPALLAHAATLPPDGPMWPSGYHAWHHWVLHRLAPATGFQRPVGYTTTSQPRAPRYLIHPHALRAAWVLLCRRYPRELGLPPVPWEVICQLGGWESVDTVRRHYYYADADEALAALRASLPTAPAGNRSGGALRGPA